MEGLSESETKYLKEVLVKETVKFFESVLSVNSNQQLDLTPLTPNRNNCGGDIPLDHRLTSVHDADYLLFVNVGNDGPEKSSGNLLAYASQCVTDVNHNGRPVVGRVFYNVYKNPTKPYDRIMVMDQDHHSYNILTSIHEVMHAFGFGP